MTNKIPTPVFAIGSVVYQRVNNEAVGMVVSYHIYPGGVISYYVTWGEDQNQCEHWDFELSDSKSFEA